MIEKIREIVDIIGVSEYKDDYMKRIKKNTENFSRKLLIAALLPIVLIFISFVISAAVIAFGYRNPAGGILTLIISVGIIIISGAILSIHAVLKKIGKTVQNLVKIAFEMIRDILKNTHSEKNVNVDEIIDNVLNLILLPKIGSIIRGSFRYFGYKIGSAIGNYVEIVLKESVLYIKEVMKSREISGYAAIKSDKYKEVIINFIQQELNDMQNSSGKFAAVKIKEIIINTVVKLRSSSKVKTNLEKLEKIINDKEQKHNALESIEKRVFSKTAKTYGKVVFYVGLAGNFVLLWGIGQIVILCFAITR